MRYLCSSILSFLLVPIVSATTLAAENISNTVDPYLASVIDILSPSRITSASLVVDTVTPCDSPWKLATNRLVTDGARFRHVIEQETMGNPPQQFSDGRPVTIQPYSFISFASDGLKVQRFGGWKDERNGLLNSHKQHVLYSADSLVNNRTCQPMTLYEKIGYSTGIWRLLEKAVAHDIRESTDSVEICYKVLTDCATTTVSVTYSINSAVALPLKIDTLIRDSLVARTIYDGWSENGGVYFPSSCTLYFPTKCAESPVEVVIVRKADFNIPVDPGLFDIDIPKGTPVLDHREQPPRSYVWP